jgi:hypothetical protein
MDVKVLMNSRFKYGYGDGVCLVLTQLCDKYLIKQNYIFKKPKFKEGNQKIEQVKGYDDIVLEENIGTNFGFKPNTGINFGGGFKHNTTGTKTKFFQAITTFHDLPFFIITIDIQNTFIAIRTTEI